MRRRVKGLKNALACGYNQPVRRGEAQERQATENYAAQRKAK